MRQNTLLIALGTLLLGSAVSAAANPTPSVPWKEKPATKKTDSTATQPPTKGARVPVVESVRVQFWKPMLLLPMMPAIIRPPTAKKMITVTTLMPANQYSASAYAFTDKRFSVSSTTKKPMAHRVVFECGNQNFTMREPATNSAASVIDQLNQ